MIWSVKASTVFKTTITLIPQIVVLHTFMHKIFVVTYYSQFQEATKKKP